MSRYPAMFAALKERGEGAFVPFVMVGDPDPDTSEAVIEALIAGGADALELGVPFTDPVADGPTIQKAHVRALAAGVGFQDCLEVVRRVRRRHPWLPIGMLIYGNVPFAMGLERFYSECAQAGIDSVLLPDVPIRESAPFSRAAEEAGVDGEDEDGVAYASGPIDAMTGRPKRFSYRPDLVVVDGGLPQVNAARAALDAVGADVPVVGLAKRLEEVWIPGDDFPLILPRTSEALYLLQYLRDESHRFAITKHRKRRSKAQRRSVLDSIPGLGPTRQAALLKHFGSVKRIRESSVEEIAEVKGVGVGLAQTIRDRLVTSSREDTP